MIKPVLLAVLLVSLAQILPSCDGEPRTVVVGWVEEKKVDRAGGVWLITILATEYEVPPTFWREVQIGDLVKWDGVTWTIVRKATGATPTPTRTPAPTPTR